MIEITNFQGCLADSPYRGIAGSFGAGSYGIAVHEKPGVLQAQYKLTKDSGSTVTDLILHTVASSDGSTYFAGDAGKIYKRTSGGSWSNVYTTPSSVRVCGFTEFNGYFMWAASAVLYRMAIAGNWSTGITMWDGSAWAGSGTSWTGNEVDTSWHVMCKLGTSLYIGAGRYVTLCDSAFNVSEQGLDLPPDYKVIALASWADNLLIGAYSTVKDECSIFVWDGYSDSWSTQVAVPEDKIYAIAVSGLDAYVVAGDQGNIYQFIGNQVVKIKQIPGDYTSSATCKTNPGGLMVKNGFLYAGIGNSSGNPCLEGVYVYGSSNKNYPAGLTLDYLISTGYTSGIEIGAICVDGGVTFVSWKDTTGGTTYGVDKIDYTGRFNNAPYQTTVIGGNQLYQCSRVILNMEKLPASCSVTLKYRKNGDTSWTAIGSAISTTNTTNYIFPFVTKFNTIEFQLTLGTSTTSTPKINSIMLDIKKSEEVS